MDNTPTILSLQRCKRLIRVWTSGSSKHSCCGICCVYSKQVCSFCCSKYKPDPELRHTSPSHIPKLFTFHSLQSLNDLNKPAWNSILSRLFKRGSCKTQVLSIFGTILTNFRLF